MSTFCGSPSVPAHLRHLYGEEKHRAEVSRSHPPQSRTLGLTIPSHWLWRAPAMTTPNPNQFPDLWPWLWSWGCRAWSRGWSPGIGHYTAPSSGCLGGLWCPCPHHTPPSSQTCTCSPLEGERPGSDLGAQWWPQTCPSFSEAAPTLPPALPPPAPHLTSKLLLPVARHPAPGTLSLGPTGALAEAHAAVFAAGGAGPPGPLRALGPRAALLHFV